MNDIEQAISNYFKNKQDIIAVYLFGSYAAKRQRPASDIDIGLIVDFKELETVRKKQERYIADLSRMLRKDIHLVQLNGAGEVLLAQVFNKGKCLLVNNAAALSLFKMRLFAMIAEFGDYKAGMQSGFVSKLMRQPGRRR